MRRVVMKRRFLAVLLISCVLLVVFFVAVRFLSPNDGVDGSADNVLPYRPVMRKLAGVDVNDDGVEDGLDAEILERMANGTSGLNVSVLVCLWAEATNDDLDLFVSLGGVVTSGPWSMALYGFGGNISYGSIPFYAVQDPNVLLVEKNEVVRGFLAYAARQARARTVVWDTYGFRGDAATSIAVVDTGVDSSHVDFSPGFGQGDFSYKVVGWNNLVDASKNVTPYDDNGHGSHVSGMAAGNGFGYQRADGRYVVCWGANEWELLGFSSGSYVWTGVNVTEPGNVSVSLLWSSSWDSSNGNVEIVGGGPSPVVYASINTAQADTLYTVSFNVTEGNEGYYYVRTKITSINLVGPGFKGPTPIGPNIYFNVSWPYTPPQDGFPAWTGIANEARLVGVKVLDYRGWGYSEDVVDGIDWVVDNRVYYHVTVMSISLGRASSSAFDNAVDNAVRSGIFVAVAMGNSGAGAELGSPGEASNVLSVAAMDLTDNVTRYSSSGGVNSDGVLKPDITAAGGSFGYYYMLPILSVDANDNEAGGAFGEGVFDDGAPMQGTSMSTPLVAGVGALVVDALGGWDSWVYSEAQAFMVKMLLLMTATETYPKLREGDTVGVDSPTLDRGGKDVHEGYGRINADAAVEAASMTYRIGTVATGVLGSTVLDKQCWARNVYLQEGTEYKFNLSVPAGADYDLYLYNMTGDAYGEPVILAKSTKEIVGGFENITYTPGLSGRYYVVVKRAREDTGVGQFTLTSSPRQAVYLLLTVEPNQAAYMRDQSVTFAVDVFNQWNPPLESTLTLTVTGPSGYYFFDFQRISVAADMVNEYCFSWDVPDVAGTYGVEVGLVPPLLTAYDAVWLEVA